MTLKKLFVALGLAVLLIGAGVLLFKEQAMSLITKDMFVGEDNDTFNPGVAVGQFFPAIKALHNGEIISSTVPFIRDKGMVFIANRSASW